jgi:hypothetical protein
MSGGFPGIGTSKGNSLADGRQLKGPNNGLSTPASTDKSVLDDRSRVLFPDKKDAPGRALFHAQNFHAVHTFTQGPVVESVVSFRQEHFAPGGIERQSKPPGKFGHGEGESAWPCRAEARNYRENPNQGRVVTDVHEHHPSRTYGISATSWPGFSLPQRVVPLPNGFTWFTAFTYMSGKWHPKLSPLAKKIFKSFGLLDWG